MFIAFITGLLLIGLFFFGMAMHRLWVHDWAQANSPPPTKPKEESEEEAQLTKLGRPITEVRNSA